jgi:hypothetical protein
MRLGGPGRSGLESPLEDQDGERLLVVLAAGVHIADLAFDVLALLVLMACDSWDFVGCSLAVFLWTGLLSGCYVCYGTGDWSLKAWTVNLAQVSIVREAYSTWTREERPELFYTLRLLQAVLQSAPQGVLQLYAALVAALPLWIAVPSILLSTVSVALGLAMWEQKVSNGASARGWLYPGLLLCFRFTEMVSRASTIALFAAAAGSRGLRLVLLADYVAMIALLSVQQAVSAAYRVFVALPLVFVSIEPLVWPRPSHAIPKEHYYTLRVMEFCVLWSVLVGMTGASLEEYRSTVHLSLCSTVLLYFLLPCVWRLAREREGSATDNLESDEELEDCTQDDPEVAASRGLERHAIAHDSDDEEEGYLSERLLGTDS